MATFQENPWAKKEIDPPSPVRQLYYYKGSRSIGSIRVRADNIVPAPLGQTEGVTCRMRECDHQLFALLFHAGRCYVGKLL